MIKKLLMLALLTSFSILFLSGCSTVQERKPVDFSKAPSGTTANFWRKIFFDAEMDVINSRSQNQQDSFNRALDYARQTPGSSTYGSNSGSLHTDRWGNTSGNIGGNNYNTYTDQWGNTSGNIGGSNVNLYQDQWGNTSGSIGGNSYNTYKDQWGNTSGSVGGESVNLYTDQWGNTSGSVGGKSVNCYTDSWGNTTCN